MATIERVTIYPVKALDGRDVDRAEITPGATLAGDREFALFDVDGEVINGKRTARVHDLETAWDPETGHLTVDAPDETVRFALEDADGRARAADWFGAYFDVDLTVERDRTGAFVDRPSAGPSVISTATLETLADWFEDATVEGMRRRLRANVEVSGVDPFWEDRFVGDDAPSFVAGDVRFDGVKPCARCVVPERDPDTGERDPDFRTRFVRRREETFPAFADPDAFDHLYTAMLIATVPEADRGKTIRVGDSVETIQP